MHKLTRIGLTAFSIAVLSVGGYYLYWLNNTSGIVYDVERTLSEEQRQQYESILSEALQSLASVTTDEKKFEWHRKTGDALRNLGKVADAKEHYLAAIKINPVSAPAYTDLFEVLVDMRDYKGAEKNIRKALELNSTGTRWKTYIKFKQDTMFVTDEAVRELYKESLLNTNNNIGLVKEYAYFLEKINDLQAAKEYWNLAKSLDPDDAADYDIEIQRVGDIIESQPQ